MNGPNKMKLKSRLLKLQKDKAGYFIAFLCKDCKRKQFSIHRLVGLLFLNKSIDQIEVNHIDGDKSNNCITNLEWCNKSYNIKHSYRLGLHTPLKGSKHPRSKPIKDKLTNSIFSCTREAAESIGMKARTLDSMLRGEHLNKTNFIYA